jgi:hypothetical protein
MLLVKTTVRADASFEDGGAAPVTESAEPVGLGGEPTESDEVEQAEVTNSSPPRRTGSEPSKTLRLETDLVATEGSQLLSGLLGPRGLRPVGRDISEENLGSLEILGRS